ncbi:hypothetical protein AABB24_002217, partial [Solanum stoloniferum]
LLLSNSQATTLSLFSYPAEEQQQPAGAGCLRSFLVDSSSMRQPDSATEAARQQQPALPLHFSGEQQWRTPANQQLQPTPTSSQANQCRQQRRSATIYWRREQQRPARSNSSRRKLQRKPETPASSCW